MQYQGQYGTDWGKVLAFVSLTLAPAVIFYLMAQKHIIAGLTSGADVGKDLDKRLLRLPSLRVQTCSTTACSGFRCVR